MPTYQYACTTADCANRFELVQSFTDPAATECPTCSGPVRKVFSAVGVVFKGPGFYRTDSRSNGAKSGGEPAAAATKDGSSGSSTSDSSGSSTSESGSSGSSKERAGSTTSSSSSPSPAPAAASGGSTAKSAAASR